MSDLLSVREAAALLGVTRSVINYHIVAGHLSAQKVGRYYVIRREDFELFEMERKDMDYPRSVRDAVDDAVERAYEMKERRDE